MSRGIAAWAERHRVDATEVTESRYVGLAHVTTELRSIVGRLMQRTGDVRVPIPSGILFVGPNGSGKSWAARLLATMLAERGTPASLFAVGAEELTVERIARLFHHLAQRDEHTLLVIDEIDLVSRSRHTPFATREDRSVLTALLNAIDGVVAHRGITVIGATSVSPLQLDGALLRPGRLGLTVVFPYPDAAEREALFAMYLGDVPTSGDFDLTALSTRGRGVTPARIAAWVADGYGLAMADGRDAMTPTDLDCAMERDGRVTAPPAPQEPVPWRVAVHEAGHVAVAVALAGIDEVRRVTVRPLGGDTSLAWTSSDMTHTRSLVHLATAFGGIAAEVLVFDEASTGSRGDVEETTRLLVERVEAGLESGVPPVDVDIAHRYLPEGHRVIAGAAMATSAYDAWQRAEEVLADQADAIVALARILVRERELEGEPLADAITASGLRIGAPLLPATDPQATDEAAAPAPDEVAA